MAFEPISGNHAIVEAVFGVGFARPTSGPALERFVAAHSSDFKKDLPNVNRGAGLQITFGPSVVTSPIALPAHSVSFSRAKPDGTMAWQLRAEGQSIFVNCLEYSRWASVWTAACTQIARTAELIGAADNPAVSILLQYIDMFEWHGDLAEYDAGLLVQTGRAVPETILGKGPWWHLHQGWYREEAGLPGRLLERVNLDGVIDQISQKAVVRLDTFLTLELAAPTILTSDSLLKDGGIFAILFERLHALDKKLLESILTKEVAKRITLNG